MTATDGSSVRMYACRVCVAIGTQDDQVEWCFAFLRKQPLSLAAIKSLYSSSTAAAMRRQPGSKVSPLCRSHCVCACGWCIAGDRITTRFKYIYTPCTTTVVSSCLQATTCLNSCATSFLQATTCLKSCATSFVQATTGLRSCGTSCLRTTTGLRSCATSCLQATTGLRSCATSCLRTTTGSRSCATGEILRN